MNIPLLAFFLFCSINTLGFRSISKACNISRFVLLIWNIVFKCSYLFFSFILPFPLFLFSSAYHFLVSTLFLLYVVQFDLCCCKYLLILSTHWILAWYSFRNWFHQSWTVISTLNCCFLYTVSKSLYFPFQPRSQRGSLHWLVFTIAVNQASIKVAYYQECHRYDITCCIFAPHECATLYFYIFFSVINLFANLLHL